MTEINLDGYQLADLQRAIALINQAEAAGVTDVRFFRQRLENYITSRMRPARLIRKNRISRRDRCPGCRIGVMMTLPVNDQASTMVGGDFTQVRICRNCHHEEWI